MKGLIEPAAELERLASQKSLRKAQRSTWANSQVKLGNSGDFAKNAPPEIVAKDQRAGGLRNCARK